MICASPAQAQVADVVPLIDVLKSMEQAWTCMVQPLQMILTAIRCAAALLLQGMTPEEQWRQVSYACTKRYCGCLKRLAGKVSTCVGPGMQSCMFHSSCSASEVPQLQ